MLNNENHLSALLRLSVVLTGFSQFELLATGNLERMLRILQENVKPEYLDQAFELLQQWQNNAPDRERPSITSINDELKPLLNNIVTMWYLGTWTPLPEKWRPSESGSVDFVISENAYLESLALKTISSNSPGGNPPGFASWTYPPKPIEDKNND